MGNAESEATDGNRSRTSSTVTSTALCCSLPRNTEVSRSNARPVAAAQERPTARFSRRVTVKYNIKALIGRGSFSTVVRAENKVTKVPRAIKIVRIREDNFASVKTELTILRRINHPYVVVLHEAFVTSDCVYMVMELATGGELFDRLLSRSRFPEREASHVAGMIAEGVRYLHSLGITHRDLKLENILYYHPGRNSRVMITDFGLSHLGGPDDLMRAACGTPEYLAPEVIRREPYTMAVDMWALGVILYVLLSGALPFEDDNRSKLYKRIVKADYSFTAQAWRGISATAKDFVDRLLTLEPVVRMTAKEILSHRWILAFKGEVPASERDPGTGKSRKIDGKKPAWQKTGKSQISSSSLSSKQY